MESTLCLLMKLKVYMLTKPHIFPENMSTTYRRIFVVNEIIFFKQFFDFACGSAILTDKFILVNLTTN